MLILTIKNSYIMFQALQDRRIHINIIIYGLYSLYKPYDECHIDINICKINKLKGTLLIYYYKIISIHKNFNY